MDYINSINQQLNEIIDKKLITGMTTRQISEEIYTHAFVYYNFKYLPEFIRNMKISKRIYNSAANGIDLEDDGDKLHRRICYSLIWNFC